MKVNKPIKLLIVITILIVGIGCSRDGDKFSQNHTEGLTDFNRKKFERMQLDIKDKKLPALNNILPVDSIEKCFFVYYFNDVDCRNCIDKGLKLITKIDESHPRSFTIIAGMNKSRIFNLVENESSSSFFVDWKNILKKQINYSYTPALFYVSPKFNIKKTFYFLGLQDDSVRLSRFLEELE